MFIRRWGGSRRCLYASRRKFVQTWRYQSTTTAATPTISPALLARARALAVEHAQLSKKLNSEYDAQLAKKAGALSAVAEALNGWEAANNVRPSLDKRMPSD